MTPATGVRERATDQEHEEPRPDGRGSSLAHMISALALLELLDEPRDDLVQVTDDAEVRDLEDRRFGVLVDGDDRLRGLHPGPVLDRTRDPRPQVQRRRDGPARLTDLVAARVPPRIRGGARRADTGPQDIGELLHELEAVLVAEPPTTGDDQRCLADVGPIRAHLLL